MSYVAMAEKQCPVCLKVHTDNTEILIHKHLKDIPEDRRFTGMQLCEEHQKQFDDGYVFMVAVESEDPEVVRTGSILSIQRSDLVQIQDVPIPEQGIMYATESTIDMILSILKEAKERLESPTV
jgi:hypothetical protein